MINENVILHNKELEDKFITFLMFTKPDNIHTQDIIFERLKGFIDGKFELPEIFYSKTAKAMCEIILEVQSEKKVFDFTDVVTYSQINGSKLTVKSILDYTMPNDLGQLVNFGKIFEELVILSQKREYAVLESKFKNANNLEEYEQEIAKLRAKYDLTFNFKHEQNSINQILDNLKYYIQQVKSGEIKKISWGYNYIDKKFGSALPTDLSVIGARPSVGKTTFGINVFLNRTYHQDLTGIYFSFEMTKEQILTKMLSNLSFVENQKIRNAELSDDEESKIFNHGKTLATKNGYIISDAEARNVSYIRKTIKEYKRLKTGLDFIVIDYFQLMQTNKKYPDTRQTMKAVSNELKAIALEYQVNITLLAQLNRDIEQRANKIPILADLKETGDLEQDADFIGFLVNWKESGMPTVQINDQDASPAGTDGLLGVVVAKNRHGATGIAHLNFNKPMNRIKMLTSAEIEERMQMGKDYRQKFVYSAPPPQENNDTPQENKNIKKYEGYDNDAGF